MNQPETWAAVAALATSISACVIAVQTYYTRQAAQETAAAAKATLLSAEGAAATLVEAAKARLDARAPRVRVFVDAPDATPMEPSTGGGEPQPLPTSSTFRTPRDEQHPLGLRVEGTIINASDEPVSVQLNMPAVVTSHDPMTQVSEVQSATVAVMEPAASLRFRLAEARPLQEWINNWNAGCNGEPPTSIIVAEITCSDSYDDGVLDRWRIDLTGRPVEPIQGEDGGWKGRNTPGMPPVDPPTSVVHHQRTYYRSKRASQVLAEVGQTVPGSAGKNLR